MQLKIPLATAGPSQTPFFVPTEMTLAHNDAAQESTLAPVATLDLDVVNSRTAELVARNAWPREQLIEFQHEQLR